MLNTTHANPALDVSEPDKHSPDSDWSGRYPRNDIISLLSVNQHYNLAESTSQDLHLGDLMDLIGTDALASIRLGYGSVHGHEGLRETVAALSGVSRDTVLTTAGTALALHLLATELCRPGDEVVLFTPCFPPARDTLTGAGVVVRDLPLKFEDGYAVDLDAFAAALSPDTRMVSLATPQNPSGVSTPHSTVERMLGIMRAQAPKSKLFIDETYRFATYGDARLPDSAADLGDEVITASSVSKAFGAPGLRVGWMTVADPGLRERLAVAKMNIVISGSPLDETLAAHILDKREAILASRRKILEDALETLSKWQRKEENRLEMVSPDGGALCCLRLRPDLFGVEAVVDFWTGLKRHDLQLAPGSWFGESDRVFRLGFGYLPPDRLPAALQAISDCMDEVSSC